MPHKSDPNQIKPDHVTPDSPFDVPKPTNLIPNTNQIETNLSSFTKNTKEDSPTTTTPKQSIEISPIQEYIATMLKGMEDRFFFTLDNKIIDAKKDMVTTSDLKQIIDNNTDSIMNDLKPKLEKWVILGLNVCSNLKFWTSIKLVFDETWVVSSMH